MRITLSTDEWGLHSAQIFDEHGEYIAIVIARKGMTMEQFKQFLQEHFG